MFFQRCYEDGECTGGTLLAHTVVPTPEECSVDCEAQTGCQYFTHYRVKDLKIIEQNMSLSNFH